MSRAHQGRRPPQGTPPHLASGLPLRVTTGHHPDFSSHDVFASAYLFVT